MKIDRFGRNRPARHGLRRQIVKGYRDRRRILSGFRRHACWGRGRVGFFRDKIRNVVRGELIVATLERHLHLRAGCADLNRGIEAMAIRFRAADGTEIRAAALGLSFSQFQSEKRRSGIAIHRKALATHRATADQGRHGDADTQGKETIHGSGRHETALKLSRETN